MNTSYNEKIAVIDAALDKFIPVESELAPIIYESMRYSIFAGGKRLRPLLLMAAVEALGKQGESYLNIACGMEMIHTYSLIHDDLPAMDNDDYRRGKLTNHKVYDEAIAILAGDALLTLSFEVMLAQKDVQPQTLVAVVAEIAKAAGPSGMVGGQVLDMQSEGQNIPLEKLQLMHNAKTGALFTAAIKAGGMIAGANPKQLEMLVQFSKFYGLAFQITDDILDAVGEQEKIGKPVGSDEKNNKATFVTLYSVEEAKKMAQVAVNNAIECLADFGDNAKLLKNFAEKLLVRDK